MYSSLVAKNYFLIPKVYGNYISFQKKIAHEIGGFSGKREYLNILEIGAGTGITTKIINEARANIHLTSIDIDPKMVKYCKATFKYKSTLKFFNSDALKFIKSRDNNEFDIVVSAFTIHNFKLNYRIKLYEEIYKVLKKNGVFLNADKYVSDNPNKRIAALKYRVGKYIDVLFRRGEYDVLQYWINEYIRDLKPEYAMIVAKERRIMIEKGFKNLNYIIKNENKMMAIIRASK